MRYIMITRIDESDVAIELQGRNKMDPWFLMENDKLKNRLNQIPDDPITKDEVSKLKKELIQMGNANF